MSRFSFRPRPVEVARRRASKTCVPTQSVGTRGLPYLDRTIITPSPFRRVILFTGAPSDPSARSGR